jgi:signal transduction histidine kinase/CheY-like chemotaxis protein
MRAAFGVWSALSIPILTAQGDILGFFEIHNKKDRAGFTTSDRDRLLAVAQSAALAVQNALAFRRLQEAEKSAKEADTRKEQFLATLAHELRNPLAPLRNALELIRHADKEPEVGARARAIAERQLGHMVRLVDDLLDISRINRDRLELKREVVLLADVVKQALETVRPLADQLNHDLTAHLPQGPVYVNADPIRLAQVLSNLLANACKFTPPGGRIRVDAWASGSEALVRVTDNGRGIPEHVLPNIFEMFAQVNRSALLPDAGLGIGLALAQRLAQLHGGKIEVHSEGENRGSAFTVRLPQAEVPATVAVSPQRQDQVAVSPCRILVVDDNRDSAESLAELLRLKGNEVLTVWDGLEAVTACLSFRPDIALLDIGMPTLSGYEAAERIRKLPNGRDMLLVAVTGWGQEADVRRSLQAGFDRHLVKPVEPAVLESLVATRAAARAHPSATALAS